MRWTRRGLVTCLGVIGLVSVAPATVLRVPSEYPTIQAGIDAATEGDTVLVADGLYTGDGNRDLDFLGKPIVVVSENGAEVTTIDCEGDSLELHQGFYFHSGEDTNSVVQGFTIRNGYGPRGGGIYCVYYSSPSLLENVILGNGAYWCGGGIACTDSSSPRIIGNAIVENTARTDGGGIYCFWGSSPTIKDNTIAENVACSGGGILCYDHCSPLIENNIIAENSVHSYGGGLVFDNYSSPSLAGNTIVNNTGTYGGGVCVKFYSNPTVTNSILWTNTPREIQVIYISSIAVTYSDVKDGWEGEGNIDADPLFVSGPHGDYYLSQIAAGQPVQSPCVDAGDSSSPVPQGTTRSDEVWDLWPVDMGYHYPSSIVGVAEDCLDETVTPSRCLAHNYPNPFRSRTTITYSLSALVRVRLTVYDIRGAMVRTLISGTVSPGEHRVVWDGTDDYGRAVASGVYFYCLSADAWKEARRMVILR